MGQSSSKPKSRGASTDPIPPGAHPADSAGMVAHSYMGGGLEDAATDSAVSRHSAVDPPSPPPPVALPSSKSADPVDAVGPAARPASSAPASDDHLGHGVGRRRATSTSSLSFTRFFGRASSVAAGDSRDGAEEERRRKKLQRKSRAKSGDVAALEEMDMRLGEEEEEEVPEEFMGWDGRRATMTVQEIDREEKTRKKIEANDEEFNQTGQSLYEIRAAERYSSVPNRDRPKDYISAVNHDMERRESRAKKKADQRASREERKTEKLIRRGKIAPPQVVEKGTVQWALNDAKRIGVLNLAKMNLAAVPDNVFEDLPGTTRLINLSENSLSAIDPRFTEFVLVQRLIASSNQISAVPQVISRMTALRKIDLANNKLTVVPDSFADMPHLEHVDLSSNGLSTLPDSFASLNLTSLRLSHNRFTAAPRVIEAMRSLQEIYLDNNNIVAVPPTWSALTQLFKLALDVNHIADFPDEVLARCADLHNLSLRGNPITAARLESKPSWNAYQSRRLLFHKYRLDQGTVTMDELRITDA